MIRNRIGKGVIVVGCFLLSVTAFLHLYLGLPPIFEAIEKGFIKSTNSMSPAELLGIWICFSVVIIIAVFIALYNIRKAIIDKVTVILVGMVAILSGLTMFFSIPGIHISVPLLCFPGILIIVGTLIYNNSED